MPEICLLSQGSCKGRFPDAGLSWQDVGYPEFLNIRPYMSQSNGCPVVYGLYAVLVHSGYSCHAGHYYCYVKVSSPKEVLWGIARSVHVAEEHPRRPGMAECVVLGEPCWMVGAVSPQLPAAALGSLLCSLLPGDSLLCPALGLARGFWEAALRQAWRSTPSGAALLPGSELGLCHCLLHSPPSGQ